MLINKYILNNFFFFTFVGNETKVIGIVLILLSLFADGMLAEK